MALCPVGKVSRRIQATGQLPNHFTRLEEIVKFQSHAGDSILQTVKALCIFHADQRQTTVVLEHADFKEAGNGKSFQARHNAGRGHHTLRRDQRQPVANIDAQRPRKFAAQHDVE